LNAVKHHRIMASASRDMTPKNMKVDVWRGRRTCSNWEYDKTQSDETPKKIEWYIGVGVATGPMRTSADLPNGRVA